MREVAGGAVGVPDLPGLGAALTALTDGVVILDAQTAGSAIKRETQVVAIAPAGQEVGGVALGQGDETVLARSFDDGIHPRVEREGVGVDAGAANQRIGAGAAIERICAVAPEKRVAAAPA